MAQRHYWPQAVCVLVMAYLCVAPRALSQRLIWLGTLGGGNESCAWGVSADGRVVVGEAVLPDRSIRAFHWTQETGMQDLGTLGGSYSWAYGISANGLVVVGESWDHEGAGRAFRWTSGAGMQDLGTLGGDSARAYAVSADGSVVVGCAADIYQRGHACRWAGGVQDLGTLGRYPSVARGVSADGKVVIGWSYDASGQQRAFRWTQETGMQSLGTLGGAASEAYGVSADGKVVVGWSYDGAGRYRAFRWTAESGMQDLGTLGGPYSYARGVSADGSVVVGYAYDRHGGQNAVRWTLTSGVEDLNRTYANLLPFGAKLSDATAISPNGRYIVGFGIRDPRYPKEAFLLDTGPCTYHISGRLELRDFVGDVTRVPISVELRQGGAPVRTGTIYVDASGNYTIAEVENGTYDLAFKASHWLRTMVAGVQVSDMDVSGLEVSLTNGDVDGDNEVSLFDFGALMAAFGSVPGDGNWNPDADLNGDEEVTLSDFGILVRNFGATGDE